MTNRPLRVALYARVSTTDQTTDNQLLELRRYAKARGWTATEYVDEGVSGAKESRPALDRLLKDARRRRLDALVVWRLDRFARNLRALILTLDELNALGVSFVSLGEGLDTTTPAGRLQLHILGAIAEFERARIAERVKAGVDRARRQGRRLGRPEREVPESVIAPVRGLSVREAAKRLGYRPRPPTAGWQRRLVNPRQIHPARSRRILSNSRPTLRGPAIHQPPH
jgi:DNA invertase Pin-like site-specific DNA recombinase